MISPSDDSRSAISGAPAISSRMSRLNDKLPIPPAHCFRSHLPLAMPCRLQFSRTSKPAPLCCRRWTSMAVSHDVVVNNSQITGKAPPPLVRTKCLMFRNTRAKTNKRNKILRCCIVLFDGYSRSLSRQSVRHSRRPPRNCAAQNATKTTVSGSNPTTWSVNTGGEKPVTRHTVQRKIRPIPSSQLWYTRHQPT
jgi:hypothetical protein